MSDQLTCRLTISSELRLLPAARAFVETFCQIAGLDRSAANAVVLAADEAVNNAIRHAHRGRPEALVEIECALLPDGIEIRLLDEGGPFDLDSVPDLNPAELRVGGRGVYLMRTLMDELACERRAQGGNLLRMVKRYPRAAPPTAAP